jgi:hypothetical protein
VVGVVAVPTPEGVSKVNVKGAWKPDGNVTGWPLIVAANAAGAPAITTTGPVAYTMWDCPANKVPVKRTVRVAGSSASTQHSPDDADSDSE